jgi:hypothetical protein
MSTTKRQRGKWGDNKINLPVASVRHEFGALIEQEMQTTYLSGTQDREKSWIEIKICSGVRGGI